MPASLSDCPPVFLLLLECDHDKAAEDMKKLLDAHAKTADEREALSERLEKEAVERRKIEKTKGMLLGKLQAMEAKLIQARAWRSIPYNSTIVVLLYHAAVIVCA